MQIRAVCIHVASRIAAKGTSKGAFRFPCGRILFPISFSISFPPWSNSVPQFASQRLGGSFGSALHEEGNFWRLGRRLGVEAGRVDVKGICGGFGGNLALGGDWGGFRGGAGGNWG